MGWGQKFDYYWGSLKNPVFRGAGEQKLLYKDSL